MKTKILVINRDRAILEQVLSMLEENGYQPTGKQKDEQVIIELMHYDYDVFLIGGDVQMSSREIFKRIIASSKPGLKIMEQFGGPENLLSLIQVGQETMETMQSKE